MMGQMEPSGRSSEPTTLRGVFGELKLREVLGLDLLVGLGGAAGATWLAVNDPKTLSNALPNAVVLVGVVIGAVIAGTALVASFMNPSFLRKMRAISVDPVKYLAPFLLTGVVGTAAAIAAIVLSALPSGAPSGLRYVLAGLTGFSVFYALASTAPNLTTLVRFIRLQSDAAEVSDDLSVLRPGGDREKAG
jgi:hypothetical protein